MPKAQVIILSVSSIAIMFLVIVALLIQNHDLTVLKKQNYYLTNKILTLDSKLGVRKMSSGAPRCL